MNNSGRQTPALGNRWERESESPNSITGLGKSLVRDTADSFKNIGAGFIDQMMGTNENHQENQEQYNPHKQEQFRPVARERITVFNFREQQERKELQNIKELLKQIKEEVAAIKKANSALIGDIKDAEKLTVESNPKGNLYNMSFLEVVLKILHQVNIKLSESSTWLHAMQNKRGKGVRSSKKADTSYEVSNSRKH